MLSVLNMLQMAYDKRWSDWQSCFPYFVDRCIMLSFVRAVGPDVLEPRTSLRAANGLNW